MRATGTWTDLRGGLGVALAMAGCASGDGAVAVAVESPTATLTTDADGTSFDGAFTLSLTGQGESATDAWLFSMMLTAGNQYGPYDTVDPAPAVTVHREFPITLHPGQRARVAVEFTALAPQAFLASLYQPSFFLEGTVYSSSGDELVSFGGDHRTPIVPR